MLKNLGKQVCSNCGSDQVQTVMWVWVNTDIPDGEYGQPDDLENFWCAGCEEHHALMTEEDFKASNNVQ